MIIEKSKTEVKELNYTGGWYNVLFLKDGTCIHGIKRYSSMREAADGAKSNEKDLERQRNGRADQYIEADWHERKYKYSDRMFFIQLPC